MLTAFPKVRGALQRLQLVQDILTIMRSKAQQGGLSFWRQAGEMLWLKLRRQQTYRFYLMARMWRPDLPWQDKLDHFNHADFSALIDHLNPPAARQRYRHKPEQKQILLQHGIATPPWYGYFHPQHGRCANGKPLTTAAELTALLDGLVDRQITLKRVVGSGGQGFLSFLVRRDADTIQLEHPLTRARISMADLLRMLQQEQTGYLIEHYLVQHPALARLNPDSVNTLRIWATREAGQLRVVGSFLRVGRRHVLVDNTAAGGLICTVDEQNGRLLELSSGDLWRKVYAQHPDTGINVTGLEVPFFHEAETLACQALACFPDMAIAGLDIAITEQGPSVIEINLDNPAQIGSACFDKPGRRLFPSFFATRKL